MCGWRPPLGSQSEHVLIQSVTARSPSGLAAGPDFSPPTRGKEGHQAAGLSNGVRWRIGDDAGRKANVSVVDDRHRADLRLHPLGLCAAIQSGGQCEIAHGCIDRPFARVFVDCVQDLNNTRHTTP